MTQSRVQQPVLFADSSERSHADWTFNGAATRELTHCYHDYPARMIPQIAAKIIEEHGPRSGLIFDPYCGTGTSLVEGMVRGLNCVGTDLNPLARLIATAKTDLPSLRSIDNAAKKIEAAVQESPSASPPSSIPGITDLEFWFQPSTLGPLARLLALVNEIKQPATRRFMMVALSETIRDCSNTRASEFKLYRYPPEVLERYCPDVHATFRNKVQRNRAGLSATIDAVARVGRQGSVNVFDFNTVELVPQSAIENRSVDLVATSPPYGDSQTTVAYGQYSRLSAAWLGLDRPHNIDRRLMGSGRSDDVDGLIGSAIQTAVSEVRTVDTKRGGEVARFYLDLQASIQNIAGVIKRGGRACYVVGNRKVKGVVLPTSEMVKDVFESRGFSHVGTFTRSIPNKRMPLKNSPSNVAGSLDATMTAEYIVVMRKR